MAEIPAWKPVDVGSLSHSLRLFYTSQVVGPGISEPSTVWINSRQLHLKLSLAVWLKGWLSSCLAALGLGLGPWYLGGFTAKLEVHMSKVSNVSSGLGTRSLLRKFCSFFFETTKILQHVVSIDTGIIPRCYKMFFVSIVMRKASMGLFTVLAVEHLCAIPILWLCWWIPTYSSIVMFCAHRPKVKVQVLHTDAFVAVYWQYTWRERFNNDSMMVFRHQSSECSMPREVLEISSKDAFPSCQQITKITNTNKHSSLYTFPMKGILMYVNL